MAGMAGEPLTEAQLNKLRTNLEKPDVGLKVVSGQVCPKCGGAMVEKKNRYGGTFLACEKYPKCKGALPVTTEFSCPTPGCTGMLVSRVARNSESASPARSSLIPP